MCNDKRFIQVLLSDSIGGALDRVPKRVTIYGGKARPTGGEEEKMTDERVEDPA